LKRSSITNNSAHESTYNSQSAIVENDVMLSKQINRVSRSRDPCVNVPHRNKGSNTAMSIIKPHDTRSTSTENDVEQRNGRSASYLVRRDHCTIGIIGPSASRYTKQSGRKCRYSNHEL